MYKLWIAIGITFYTVTAFAERNDWIYENNPEIDSFRIYGQNCDELISRANAIKAWKQRVDQNAQDTLVSCLQDKERFYIDLKIILPEAATDLLRMSYSKLGGPNCFSTVLYVSKLHSHLSYVSPKEFRTFVQSSFCRELKSNEQPTPGDLGVYRLREKLGVHAFVFIIHKQNDIKTTSWEFQTFDHQINSHSHPDLKLTYFNCDFQIQTEHLMNQVSDTLRIIKSAVDNIDQCVSLNSVKNGTLNTKELVSLIHQISTFKSIILNESSKTLQDQFTSEYLNRLSLRLDSLKSQTEFNIFGL
jgi:hypothetical protein